MKPSLEQEAIYALITVYTAFILSNNYCLSLLAAILPVVWVNGWLGCIKVVKEPKQSGNQ